MSLGPIAAIAATAASAAGPIISGISRRNQLEAQAEAAELQAAAQAERRRRAARRQMGATRAAFASRGVQLRGTPLDVLADQAMELEEDAALIEFGGQQRARTFRSRGQSALFSGIAQGVSSGVGTGISLRGAFGGGPSSALRTDTSFPRSSATTRNGSIGPLGM